MRADQLPPLFEDGRPKNETTDRLPERVPLSAGVGALSAGSTGEGQRGTLMIVGRLLPVVLFVIGTALFLLAAGCQSEAPRGEAVVYEGVRGRVLGTADGGRALVVDHEAVPGVMPSMTMALRLEDPAAAEGLTEGAPIEFDLVTSDDVYIRNIEPLPPGTALDLPSDSAQAAPGPLP